ncbi:MAG: carbon storage regulator CsrA [Verrucomicrobium sp.]|nr:carbon storage regulator CsrA [Verrucomicrobium sp.]
MLVLSRKPGEAVKLGDEIEIIIVAVEGQRVRLGIKAPRDVRILRTEIDPQLAHFNQQAVVKADAASLLGQAAAKAKQASANANPDGSAAS